MPNCQMLLHKSACQTETRQYSFCILFSLRSDESILLHHTIEQLTMIRVLDLRIHSHHLIHLRMYLGFFFFIVYIYYNTEKKRNTYVHKSSLLIRIRLMFSYSVAFHLSLSSFHSWSKKTFITNICSCSIKSMI